MPWPKPRTSWAQQASSPWTQNGDATKSAVVLVVKDGQFKLVDVVHPR
jgi:hypothetical protein